MSRPFYRLLYRMLCAIGRPFGGVRPRRLYDILGRLAYPAPEFSWHRNRWGSELRLSPHLHIDRNILVFGTYDEELHLLFEKIVQPGMVCMDIGANLGEMTLHLAQRAAPDGRVYAFEPVASVFGRLQENVERNRSRGGIAPIEIFPLALSDSDGRCEIAYADDEQDNQGLASIVNLNQKLAPRRAVIQTQTLDSFVAEQQIRRLDFIKIDIQGAELKMLSGAKQTLATLAPDICLEISPEDLRACGSDSRALGIFLKEQGYFLHKLRGGEIGERLDPELISPDFRATNVFCTKKAH